ncbi:MAG TPA: DUF4387 domain-containing protein [Chloroflexota bacterium]|nr:DUF4387 domain-containing protein [Chloroflexota bacterium]
MSLLPGNGRVVPLRSLAKTIRSKNAGCHYYTMDIIFAEHETYRRVMATGVITRELISLLYGIPQARIVELVPYEHGNAVKITIRRAVTSGDVGDTDVYGCQQYIPLLDIPIPWEGDLPQAPSPSWH